MKIVSNATPIISLSSIGKVGLLKELFGEVIVSRAVYNEIKAKRSYGYEEIDADFFQIKSIRGMIYADLLLNQLDRGEAETIILAKETDADLVAIDESIGYKIAKNAGLEVVRTLSILLRAKDKGLISEVKPLLDDMIAKGRWYSNSVYEKFLKKANEL